MKPTTLTPEQERALGLLGFWWACLQAEMELAGDPPFGDGDVVLHFVGSGATAMVMAGDLRAIVGIGHE